MVVVVVRIYRPGALEVVVVVRIILPAMMMRLWSSTIIVIRKGKTQQRLQRYHGTEVDVSSCSSSSPSSSSSSSSKESKYEDTSSDDDDDDGDGDYVEKSTYKKKDGRKKKEGGKKGDGMCIVLVLVFNYTNYFFTHGMFCFLTFPYRNTNRWTY